MLGEIIIQILLLTFKVGDIDHFVESCTRHFTEVGAEEKPSSMPDVLENELKTLLDSQLGKKVHRACIKSKQHFRFVKVSARDAYFAEEGNVIYYATDVKGWYELRKEEFNERGAEIPHGSNLHITTLGAQIAHEIGHTEIGRLALGIPYIDRSAGETIVGEDGSITLPLDRKKLRLEETRATKLFENAYRRHVGLPLRYSYFEPFDVLIE